jgi:predicted ATP-dependent endonuclease of OLD family
VRIACIEVSNFRKLKATRIDFAKETTILVGANNSGKTTAMEALRIFLGSGSNEFRITDFTLSDFARINRIGLAWEKEAGLEAPNGTRTPDAEIPNGADAEVLAWDELSPTLDVWIEVSADEKELHLVSALLPMLDPYQGVVGMRLRLEPKDEDELRQAYLEQRTAVVKTIERAAAESRSAPVLRPVNLVDFLRVDLNKYFSLRPYQLDPSRLSPPLKVGSREVGNAGKDGVHIGAQATPRGSEPLDRNPLIGLIRVDAVPAQRGLDHASGPGKLSKQISTFYERFLDQSTYTSSADLDAMHAMQQATDIFNDELERHFKSPLAEVASMGYPGRFNPHAVVKTTMRLMDGLDRERDPVLHYRVGTAVPGEKGSIDLELPEGLNGLGYQNFVFMIFSLLIFREARLQVPTDPSVRGDHRDVPLLHLVLVEEPEAYLHAQVQQAFVRFAYERLTKELRRKAVPGVVDDFEAPELSTQLVVSTHSSHIVHERDFDSVRYFRRDTDTADGVPTATICSLNGLFGADDQTKQFVRRYLRLHHYNILFADAVVLIEGTAERMFLPRFILDHFPHIRSSYVEYLEIGGAHAHRLRPLLEMLAIPTLVITDVDAVELLPSVTTNNKVIKRWKSAIPDPSPARAQKTSNETLKTWLSRGESITELMALGPHEKVATGGVTRFAFQTGIALPGKVGAYPRTFEDSLILTNRDLFADSTWKGAGEPFAAQVRQARTTNDFSSLEPSLYELLGKANKGDLAADILWSLPEGAELMPPAYIREGLEWLSNVLQPNRFPLHFDEQKGEDPGTHEDPRFAAETTLTEPAV